MIKFVIPLLALPLVLQGTGWVGPGQVDAQEGTGPITGQIINGTDDREVQAGLPIMLHSWTRISGEGPMEHGTSGPGGALAFEGIQIEPGTTYVAMAQYQGVAYFSAAAVASEQETLPPFQIVVYETTADPAAVTVDSLHVVLQPAQGGLGVAEFYILSNRGDHTVAGLGAASQAPLRFWLPENAANVAFPGSEGDRFVFSDQAFSDTAALVPGEGSGQVAVSYVLDYQDELRLQHALDLPVTVTSILVPFGTGLEVAGGSMEFAGTRSVENAGVYEVYQLGPLQAGEPLEFGLSGTLAAPAVEEGEARSRSPLAGRGLPFGLAVLGGALLGGGIWWWWRISAAQGQDELADDGTWLADGHQDELADDGPTPADAPALGRS